MTSLSDDEIAEVGRLLSEANSDDAKDGLRSDLFDRYMGETYGDEVEGKSKFVDTTVSDAVEAVLTDILDIFTSQEHIAQFKPVGPEDADAARQETDVVHHVFWEKNNGFENLYVWFKEAVIQQNSYCWSGWVDQERVTIEEYEDLTIEELVTVIAQYDDGEVEVLEQEGFEEDELGPFQVIGEDGEPEPISIKIRCTKKSKQYVIEPFPQEDFFCTPRWGRVSLDGVPCCGRKYKKRKAEALAMGFDPVSIEDALGDDSDEQENRRHQTKDSSESDSEGKDELTIYEAYMVLERDGREGLFRVYTSDESGTILKWKGGKDCVDEVSRRRISCLTPMIVQHRHIGRSVAERVDDIQQVNTVLMRQTLDNLYATNYGRPYFDDNLAGEHTYSDLTLPEHGSPVRTGGADIQWYTPPSIAGTTLPILEKMSSLKEERTGATRYNQGLDAESLNKTVGGMGMILNASQKKNKLVARTFAETGLRDLFLRMHADLRAGPWKEMAIQLRGDWVSVDPRTWQDRTDMTVTIGMGKGDQDMRRQGHMQLGQIQRELAGSSQMVGEAEIYNNIRDAAATFGIEQIDPYVRDPATIPPAPPAPPPPDPLMLNFQIEQEKVAAKERTDMQKAQMDHEYRMRQLDLQDTKLANDIQTDDEKLALERSKAVMADDLARDQMINANTPTNELTR